ncbi:MAG TPA: thioredoxin-like domain-containing protein [Bacteroidales bacterium]|nr:redoxin domain-containing protein [Bacteroidales bacterium]MBP8958991.1 redoxin domain-containing protein [Bacteroidales bacterium]HOU95110.1 thioredoxin-like domain-containing protein [Bacteroidales bacterium]HQG36400.1 thioredoxin-like domain-containing protein [Bacteroidales bacterium]HQG53426.1 thioredoxin-like domain-containing protein [Bacteroidales bacterium]
MRSLITYFLIIFSIEVGCQVNKGYEIALKIDGLADSTLYLAYHFGDKQYIKDSIRLDKSGAAVIKGNEPLPQGIYMIVLPGKKYFEILISDDQNFEVTCSYPDYFNSLKFKGSEENSAFLDYQRNWIKLQAKASELSERYKKNKNNPDSLKILGEARIKQETQMKNFLREVAERYEGTLLAMLVKAIIPVEIPPFNIPEGTRNPDSVRYLLTYLYNKDHYFDNIDFNDERILRTPIFHSKLNDFFSNVVIQLADSINKEIDRIIALSSNNYKIFQYVSVYLFNHFRESEIMGHDAIIVKLADEIYLSGKADWTTQEWRDNLKKEVDRIRPNLIGVKAHDLVMNTFNNVFVSLYDIKKDFTILVFWEPDCGHCQQAIPILRDYYEKNKDKGIEVFAVCTQPDREKWEKYIQENRLTWINGWDPQRITRYDYYYNITSTPLIYILDREKKIIAKKLPVESIESFIDDYRKNNR